MSVHGSGASFRGGSTTLRGGFMHAPSTRQGRWAMLLIAANAAAFALFLGALVLMHAASGTVAWSGVALEVTAHTVVWSGLVGSGLALFALTVRHERSWIAYLAIVPLMSLVLVMIWDLVSAIARIAE